jgi:hypothetical protein
MLSGMPVGGLDVEWDTSKWAGMWSGMLVSGLDVEFDTSKWTGCGVGC